MTSALSTYLSPSRTVLALNVSSPGGDTFSVTTDTSLREFCDFTKNIRTSCNCPLKINEFGFKLFQFELLTLFKGYFLKKICREPILPAKSISEDYLDLNFEQLVGEIHQRQALTVCKRGSHENWIDKSEFKVRSILLSLNQTRICIFPAKRDRREKPFLIQTSLYLEPCPPAGDLVELVLQQLNGWVGADGDGCPVLLRGLRSF